VPIIECPEPQLPFKAWRTTLTPIFQGRGEEYADADQWPEERFVERLRSLLTQVVPESPPIGFDYLVAQNATGEFSVTLTWQKDAEASFVGCGKTENFAFLDAAAKAYAHPTFRKLLDLHRTPQHDPLQGS